MTAYDPFQGMSPYAAVGPTGGICYLCDAKAKFKCGAGVHVCLKCASQYRITLHEVEGPKLKLPTEMPVQSDIASILDAMESPPSRWPAPIDWSQENFSFGPSKGNP